ncbi:hypothetical protein Tco_0949159 [Tanacetum coccineum]
MWIGCHSFSVSPMVRLLVAGRGGAGKGGSCVLIPDLVVMAKVGASGIGSLAPVLLEEDASSSKRFLHKSFGWLVLHSYNQDTLTSRLSSNWDPRKYRADLERRFGYVNIKTLIKQYLDFALGNLSYTLAMK